MAYKTIHNGALDFADESQQVVRCARVTLGPSVTDGDGAIHFHSTGVKHLLWMPANTVIFDMKAQVLTAFATGQEITFGDTVQAAGFGDTAYLATASAVTTGILKGNPLSVYLNATGKLGGYKLGTARYINATVTTPGATKLSTSSTGKIELFVLYAVNGAD